MLVRGRCRTNDRGPIMNFSSVLLEQAMFVSSLLHCAGAMNFPAFENKKRACDMLMTWPFQHWRKWSIYEKISSKNKPIRALGFTLRLPCDKIAVVILVIFPLRSTRPILMRQIYLIVYMAEQIFVYSSTIIAPAMNLDSRNTYLPHFMCRVVYTSNFSYLYVTTFICHIKANTPAFQLIYLSHKNWPIFLVCTSKVRLVTTGFSYFSHYCT